MRTDKFVTDPYRIYFFLTCLQLLEFSKEDSSNPRAWSKGTKLENIAIIASMSSQSRAHILSLSGLTFHAVLSPLASSMFAPGIDQIAADLKTSRNSVIGCQTGFVVMLGVGPLILAPLSETFGRKSLYLTCFTVFTILQIPTALSPNLAFLILMRTFSGFFGSMAILYSSSTRVDPMQALQLPMGEEQSVICTSLLQELVSLGSTF